MDKLRSISMDQRRFIARVARSNAAFLTVFALVLCLSFTRPAHAMKIQEIKSPGGIEAWLVEAHENPLLALKFSFEGGNAQDPAGKDGVANFLTAMLDEGAGDLDLRRTSRSRWKASPCACPTRTAATRSMETSRR